MHFLMLVVNNMTKEFNHIYSHPNAHRRESEVAYAKTSKKLKRDAHTTLSVTETRAVLVRQFRLLSAFHNACCAEDSYDFADLISFKVHQAYCDKLLEQFQSNLRYVDQTMRPAGIPRRQGQE